jgi:hypothetical protein
VIAAPLLAPSGLVASAMSQSPASASSHDPSDSGSTNAADWAAVTTSNVRQQALENVFAAYGSKRTASTDLDETAGSDRWLEILARYRARRSNSLTPSR